MLSMFSAMWIAGKLGFNRKVFKLMARHMQSPFGSRLRLTQIQLFGVARNFTLVRLAGCERLYQPDCVHHHTRRVPVFRVSAVTLRRARFESSRPSGNQVL